MNHILAQNNIKREKYLKESLFLKFFDILCNKASRWSQKFAIGVTKLMPPDEIRRFDGRSGVQSGVTNCWTEAQRDCTADHTVSPW